MPFTLLVARLRSSLKRGGGSGTSASRQAARPRSPWKGRQQTLYGTCGLSRDKRAAAVRLSFAAEITHPPTRRAGVEDRGNIFFDLGDSGDYSGVTRTQSTRIVASDAG